MNKIDEATRDQLITATTLSDTSEQKQEVLKQIYVDLGIYDIKECVDCDQKQIYVDLGICDVE